jgi:hypothetical protein
MVGVLEIIFGLDPVAGQLGVARQAFIFFVQLGSIPALTIILSVPRLSAEVLAPLSPTAASAAALTIVDQMPTPFAVVASPLGPRTSRAALYCAGPDPLVPVCA